MRSKAKMSDYGKKPLVSSGMGSFHLDKDQRKYAESMWAVSWRNFP
ncbi:hypothetical protein COLO4_25443 [Corchorus olitorius]|uniref:Uncharacterized protein n=1 Tax=Corchorus olitorius TaxID=93759 RepID=A0A1R3I2H6_9ROSI|nr:hypothetical protein COLO4_25443 [Corchorus olitorius]